MVISVIGITGFSLRTQSENFLSISPSPSPSTSHISAVSEHVVSPTTIVLSPQTRSIDQTNISIVGNLHENKILTTSNFLLSLIHNVYKSANFLLFANAQTSGPNNVPVQVTIASGAGGSQNAACVTNNNCFYPSNAQVTAGGTVQWTNTDSASHTVTSGKVTDNIVGTLFDSGIIKPGTTFSVAFTQTSGVFNYFCSIHPWMTGSVTIQGTSSTPTHPNLFVSAENSQYGNYFAGPQVIQVIVTDPDINRLDQAYGEPVVTINGKKLRMAQATDGNWYAYFADRNQAVAAANTVAKSGKGLNFGGFCSASSTLSVKSGVTFTDTQGFTIARGGFGSTNHTSANVLNTTGIANQLCSTGSPATSGQMEHVVRQNKTLNTNPSGFAASSTYENVWPIIQLYDFSSVPTAVTVDYQKNGGDQIVNLNFDRIPVNMIGATLDRGSYPPSSEVYVNLYDPQLNIDPTDKNSWTWGSNSNNETLFYQAFDKNGNPDADGTSGMQNVVGNLTSFLFNHNGKLSLNLASSSSSPATKLRGTGLQILNSASGTNSISSSSQPITFLETDINSGVFINYDSSVKSDLITVSDISSLLTSSIRYNDISYSILAYPSSNFFGYDALNSTKSVLNNLPIAFDNTVSTNQNTDVSVFLSGTTKNNTPLVFVLSSNPIHGTLSNFDPVHGRVIYTPDTNFVGTDSFTFKTNDGSSDSGNVGTITLTVNSVIPSPVANILSPSNANSGTVVTLDSSQSTVAPGHAITHSWLQTSGPQVVFSSSNATEITFTSPSVTSSTILSIILRISDGSATSLASTTIQILPVPNVINAPPIKNNTNIATTSWFLASSNFSPTRFALDPSGNVFITGSNKVAFFDISKNNFTKWTVPSSSPDTGIAVDSHGKVYFTENSTIEKLDPQTNIFTEYNVGNGTNPYLLARGPSDNIYFAESRSIGILKPSNNVLIDYNMALLSPAVFVSSLAVDNSGSVYFTDYLHSTVGKLDTTTNVLTKWTLPTKNSNPSSVAVDSTGNIYFTESGGRIGKVTTSTNTITEWRVVNDEFGGVGGAIAVDPYNDVFYTVSDSGGNLGRLVPSTGTITEWSDVHDSGTLIADPSGNLYLGSTDGITKVTGPSVH